MVPCALKMNMVMRKNYIPEKYNGLIKGVLKMKTRTDLQNMVTQKDKIVMITAYDYPSAQQVEAAGADMILVGDSLGMVVLGYDSTVQVTVSDMIHHAQAVRR